MCTETTCQHIVYNADSTRVCSKYGICFGQKLCDSITQPQTGSVNTKEHTFVHVLKRDQQIGNKKIIKAQIMTWVRALIVDVTDRFVTDLTEKIHRLWVEIVEIATRTGLVIHRRYRRCVAVAIISSLGTGLSTRTGMVIEPHGENNIQIVRFNKRTSKLASDINISDIRAGQRILKMIFDDHKCVNVVNKIDMYN